MKKNKLILIALVAILIIIQFFKIDKSHPELSPDNDYLVVANAPQGIKSNITKSCYDCHSYQTTYPWYSNIAPVSWMINHHIDEGREHINFSEWGNYPLQKQTLVQEECMEEVEENGMPLKSYTMIHKDAKLSETAKEDLIKWFRSQTTSDTLK